MKKLSKEKRQQLVLVFLLTAGSIVGIYFGLIKPLRQSIIQTAERRGKAEKQIQEVRKAISEAAEVEKRLADVSERVSAVEETMASGDLYSWVYNTIREFKTPYTKIEIPQFSQVEGPRPVNILPRFPYQQAVLSVGGTALYYDLGQFIADFENRFPYARVTNLMIEPASAATAADAEKLAFRFDISILVKPGVS